MSGAAEPALLDFIGAGAATGTAAAIIAPFTQRLAAWAFPTPVETAQMANMAANLDLARERLRAEEQRAIDQIQAARERQIEQIQASRELQEYIHQMKEWPIRGVMAANLLKRSSAHRGRSLNIIIKITTTDDPAKQPDGYARSQKMLRRAIDETGLQADRLFDSDIILYKDLHPASYVDGEALRSTLFGLLASEPIVLIEARVREPMEFLFSVSCWGWSFDQNVPITRAMHLTFDLLPASLAIDSKNPEAVQSFTKGAIEGLQFAVLGMITQFTDAFHALRRPHDPPALRLPRVMVEASARGLSDAYWMPVIDQYITLHDQLGKSAPALAADATAHMALAMQESGHTTFADRLLNKALSHYRAGLRPPVPSDEDGLIGLIMAQPAGKQMNRVVQALRHIRGLEADGAPPPPRLSLLEMARLANDRLR